MTYGDKNLPPSGAAFYERTRASASKRDEIEVPPRGARACHLNAGTLLRIVAVSDTQAGEHKRWSAHTLDEPFFSRKTRTLHAATSAPETTCFPLRLESHADASDIISGCTPANAAPNGGGHGPCRLASNRARHSLGALRRYFFGLPLAAEPRSSSAKPSVVG